MRLIATLFIFLSFSVYGKELKVSVYLGHQHLSSIQFLKESVEIKSRGYNSEISVTKCSKKFVDRFKQEVLKDHEEYRSIDTKDGYVVKVVVDDTQKHVLRLSNYGTKAMKMARGFLSLKQQVMKSCSK